MKFLKNLFLVSLLTVALGACDTDLAPLNGYVEPTQEGATTFIMKGYEASNKGFNVFDIDKSGYIFYLKEKNLYGEHVSFLPTEQTRLDAMTQVPAEGTWSKSAEVAPDKCYWVRYGDYDVVHFIKIRVVYVEGNNVCLEYASVEHTAAGPNMNSNYAFLKEYPSALNLEMPAIREVDGIYREHYVNYKGRKIMNLATSWNVALRHSAWVAFSFDDQTAAKSVKRTKDAWDWDKAYDFDTMGGVEENDHKSDGYDKGHIAASEDRVYCKEANEQTFLYTNISPQIASFNQKYWVGLEEQVQAWGRATIGSTYDKVYVVKGATLNKPLSNFTGTQKGADGKYPTTDAEGKTIKGLFVPSYYYIAILSEKDGEYQAIAFLVPHREDLPQKPTSGDLLVYAKSIDELEQETDIDFFCNLPDSIETVVEASYDKEAWNWN